MELVWLNFYSVSFCIISLVASIQGSILRTTIQSCERIPEGTVWKVPENVGHSFRLRNANKFCKEPSQTFRISNSAKFAHFEAVDEKGEVMEAHLDENGTFRFYPQQNSSSQYPVESYCISKKQSESWSEVKICCSKTNPCFRKCCPEGETWDPYVEACNSTSSTTNTHWRFENHQKFPNAIGLPQCPQEKFLLPFSTASKNFYPFSPYRIKENGDVEYYSDRAGLWVKKLDQDDYCVDQVKLSETDLESVPCPLEQDILLICLSKTSEISDQSTESTEKPKYKGLQIAYILSIFVAMGCLLATAIVLFRRKDQQNIHVWTILCYVLCQFVFYSFIVFIRLVLIDAIDKNFISEKWCTIVGVAGHFFGVSTFAWLSVINFDLWWTFRVLQPIDQKKLYSIRFGWYLVFSIFLPLIIVSISVAIHLSQKKVEPVECIATETDEQSFIFPEYGKPLCFLSAQAQLYYFYIPIGILLFINFAFYIITSYKILRLYNRSQRINSQKHRQSCQLFLKLFLVMGTLWIFQVIQAFIHAKSYELKWYWVVLDMVNIFQALAVFIIFVCNRPSHQVCSGGHGWWRCFYCCIGYKPTLYRTPTLTDRSTDGSTRISRADNVKSVVGPPEWPEPSEIIQLS